MDIVTTGILTALLVASVLALPPIRIRRDAELDAQNFVGEGTNELATAILQGFVDTDENLAISPLGTSVLMAILAEGADGETREQLVKAIHLPDNDLLRRSAYKNVLHRFTEKYTTNKPQFKNWFYIYKNFSVEQDYKTNLEENYLTEVRDVDRLDSDVSSQTPVPEIEGITEETTESNDGKKEDTTIPDKTEYAIIPEKTEDSMVSEKMEDMKTSEKMEDSVIPEKMEDSIMPEKSEDLKSPENTDDSIIPEKTEDSNIPEEMEDSIMPEKIEESIIPEKTDDAEIPEKSEDSKIEEIKPENSDESTSSEKEEDKIPEKMESSYEKKEIMQLSDVDTPSKEKDTTESRQFSSSFDYQIPSMLRKLEEERESKPGGEAITMQQEMLGDKKEESVEEIKDDKKETIDDEIKENKNEEIKEDKIECGEKEIVKDDKKSGLIDKIKHDFIESIREVIKEDKKEDKEELTNDKTGEMKDEIKEAVEANINEEKTEIAKDEIKEDDKKEGIKEEETVGENDKKEDMAGVMMEESMNLNPISEEKLIQEGALIQEEIKDKKESISALDRFRRSPRQSRFNLGIYQEKNDVSSSLSGNNIVTQNAKNKKTSQILVFNAMYFKGNWAVPFTRKKIDSFYKSDTEKSTVTMMGTQGTFRVGNIPDLDSMAIELPYQGERYSLLIVRPNSRTGLRQLISDLTGYPLRNIQKYLEPQDIEVCLPSFEIQSTTNPVESLSKLGVTDIFNQEDADLSRISKDSGLFVEELVQYVTVKVDEGSSSYNYMTASNPSTRTTMAKYTADSPFLFFIRDIQDNNVIVAGKVVDPSIAPK